MGSFYPHGKPPTYAYTTKFLTVGHDWKGAAYSNTVYPGLYSPQGKMVANKAIVNLEGIMNSARAAELAFLSATGIDVTKLSNAGDIFRKINLILNSRQTFERGLKYMEELSKIGRVKDEKTHTYRDISSLFETYLNQQLRNIDGRTIVHSTPAQIKELINNIIGNALVETYKQAKDFIDSEGNRRLMMGNSGVKKAAPNLEKGEEAVQAISDMIKIIEDLQKTGVFGNLGHLFNLGKTSEELRERIKEVKGRGKKKQKPKAATGKYNEAKVTSNYQGNILELITSTVTAYLGNIYVENHSPMMDLTFVGKHTGQLNQMKADSVILVGRGNIDIEKYFKGYMQDVKDSGYTSVRAQNIYAIRNFLDRLDDNIDHVLMISDKNLSIKADFGGAQAQGRSKLRDVGEMLGELGISISEDLINYLANCGPLMVQGEVNGEVRTELQTMIGYFLFDHLEIHIGVKASGPNVVNLINISGMYMPLSVYLEGILNSLKDITSNTIDFVNVTISPGGKTSESNWTAETWDAFRDSRENQTFISYRFLRNIADFISGL